MLKKVYKNVFDKAVVRYDLIIIKDRTVINNNNGTISMSEKPASNRKF